MVEATLFSTYSSPNSQKDAAGGEKKKPSSVAMFQDAITINIPIGVTADLGVALRRTRTKRIEAIYQAYPELKEKKESGQDDDEDEDEEDDDVEGESDAEIEGEEGEGPPKKKKKKSKKEKESGKKPGLVPQRHEYGSIMDYLEAKYVRGVMIENENETPQGAEDEDNEVSAVKNDEDDEGQGSVYSQSSFLDDRDLQRDVAEQVLAQTTTTKLELEGDDDFFVNVGDLDVEETELTQKHYDPLEDSPNKAKTPSKKRKKPSTASTAVPKAASPPAKKKTAVTKKKKVEKGKADKNNSSSKKKERKKIKVVSTKKPKMKAEAKIKQREKEENDSDDSSEGAVAVAATSKKVSKKNTEETKALKAEADKHRAVMHRRFETVKKMIKELTKEQLPRRPPLKSKVSITCPANKKEGDEVTFA